MEESPSRFNTEISNEHFYRYRPYSNMTPNCVFYGSDMDMLHKAWTGLRTGTIIGAGAGAFMFTYDQAGFVLSRAFERSFRHGMPWVYAGAAYGLAVGVTANLRGKDGPLNHVIGGLAAGAMIGSSYKHVKVGCYTGVFIAAMCGIIKLAADNDALPKMTFRRARVFNMYRTGWFTERPDPEGIQDGDKDDSFRSYRP